MEYMIDCTGWDREKFSEIFSMLTDNTNAKIVLSMEGIHNKQDDPFEKIVGNYLNKLGVPHHLRGYGYLKYGVERCIQNPEELESITKILYPAIAKKYNTTTGRVEHGIRHAIKKAWEREKTTDWELVFGRENVVKNIKPTNSQFIATVSDYIKINN